MELYEEILQDFNISALSSSSTFVDLISNMVSIFIAIFITAFFIRTIFLACTVPFDNWD